MHNSDNNINYSGCTSSLVGIVKSLSYELDLKSAALLKTGVHKLPPNMKESWSLFTVKNHWVKSTLLDFNDWLKEKAETHDIMKNTATKTKISIPGCIVCKGSHRLWECQCKCRKDGWNSSHNTLIQGAERVIPAKPSNISINNSKSSVGSSKPSTGQQHSRKTTTLFSDTDVKGFLQVTELQLGTNTTALVLCDTACSTS